MLESRDELVDDLRHGIGRDAKTDAIDAQVIASKNRWKALKKRSGSQMDKVKVKRIGPAERRQLVVSARMHFARR